MPAKSGFGGGAGGAGGHEKMRTHMMFAKKTQQEKSRRGKKRPRPGPSKNMMSHDASVQTGAAENRGKHVDPSEWTGNQRILHFGPMAARDPYFYYFPKGWDTLYPAHFGFFPYRTENYRGSSPTVCLSAFGVFFCIGGCAMSYLGFFVYAIDGVLHPLQVAGPVILLLGFTSLVAGCCWWFCSLQLFNERLRHTQPHHIEKQEGRLEFSREMFRPVQGRSVNARSPYQPPVPTALPSSAVLINPHVDGQLYNQGAELKVYPPNLPAMQSTLSLPPSAATSYYVGSPYNTLSSHYSNVGLGTTSILENPIEQNQLNSTPDLSDKLNRNSTADLKVTRKQKLRD